MGNSRDGLVLVVPSHGYISAQGDAIDCGRSRCQAVRGQVKQACDPTHHKVMLVRPSQGWIRRSRTDGT